MRPRPLIGRHRAGTVLVPAALAGALAACQPEAPQAIQPAPVPRPVRTITVEPAPPAQDIAFTGHVEARDQAALSFRVGGRLAARRVGVGSRIAEDEIVAELDAEDQLNDLRAARAALDAAEGALRKADGQYQRQRHLLDRNVTSRADFEAAEQGAVAARAQVEAARARVKSAQDIVAFTTLKADAPGIVTRIGAEPGEVVAAGRMIVELARRDGRDAIFEVPPDLLRAIPAEATVHVALAGDPAIAARGHVREVAPQADPVTRTFRVRVGLNDAPPGFRLGASVSGRIRGADGAGFAVPASALVRDGAAPRVWVVDPGSLTVSPREVELIASDRATAVIARGLAPGDVVVTAGANLLRAGQPVRLSGAAAQ